jgi:virginiamycin B lyase
MWRRARTRLPLLLLVALAALAIALPSTGAAATTDTWTAKVGASGANGAATITTTGSAGTLKLALKALTASTAYPVTIATGTCAKPGSTLWGAPTQTSTAAGKIAKSLTVPAATLTAVRTASAAGPIAIRVGSGSKLRCGPFTGGPAPTATPTAEPFVAAKVVVGQTPTDIAVATSGVWVTDMSKNTVFRVDPATNQASGSVVLGPALAAMPFAVAAKADVVWVASSTMSSPGNGSALRVDPATRAVTATIPVGPGPLDLAIGTTGVWVPSAMDGTVVRIDPATNTVTATYPAGMNPGGLAIGGGSVWVADAYGAAVVRLDETTGRSIATVKMPAAAQKVAVGAGAVWVTAGNSMSTAGHLVRIDPATNTIVADIALSGHPSGVAASDSAVWVVIDDATDAIWINPTTNAIGGRLPLGGKARAVDAAGRSAWYATIGPAQVVRIDYSAKPPVAAPGAGMPTPTPTSTPTPTPAAGGTAWVGPHYGLTAPAGWTQAPTDVSDGVEFKGPGPRFLDVSSIQSDVPLSILTAVTSASLEDKFGALPESTEATTIAGVPGKMLTYHITYQGMTAFMLVALTVHDGRAFVVMYISPPGTESVDRAAFMTVLSSFVFVPAS